mgnify:CR=1 FL=1
MRGQRREGRIPSVEPELRSGCQIDVTFYPQILAKSLFLMPDGTNSQVAFLNAEGQFGYLLKCQHC